MGAKQKILNEAAKLIHTKGFNNTSIQDILDASEVTKSNFYYHFDSKEQLGFDVLAKRMRQFNAYIVDPSFVDADITSVERIDGFLNRVLLLAAMPQGELGCPFGNLAQEMSTIHEPMRQTLSDFFGECTERIEQCFDEGKEAGEFREDLPSGQLAEFVFAQIQGAFLLRKTYKDLRVMESNIEMLRQSIRAWVRGEKPDPGHK